MAEYVHLIGTEQVQSAANVMRAAAETMVRAATTIHDAMRSHEGVMREYMERLIEEKPTS